MLPLTLRNGEKCLRLKSVRTDVDPINHRNFIQQSTEIDSHVRTPKSII